MEIVQFPQSSLVVISLSGVILICNSHALVRLTSLKWLVKGPVAASVIEVISN